MFCLYPLDRRKPIIKSIPPVMVQRNFPTLYKTRWSSIIFITLMGTLNPDVIPDIQNMWSMNISSVFSIFRFFDVWDALYFTGWTSDVHQPISVDFQANRLTAYKPVLHKKQNKYIQILILFPAVHVFIFNYVFKCLILSITNQYALCIMNNNFLSRSLMYNCLYFCSILLISKL